MKYFRLFINWSVVLTAPVWFIPCFMFKEFKDTIVSIAINNRFELIDGRKFFWGKIK